MTPDNDRRSELPERQARAARILDVRAASDVVDGHAPVAVTQQQVRRDKWSHGGTGQASMRNLRYGDIRPVR
jgi:hypothetical protein